MNRKFAIAAVLALALGTLPVLAQGPGFGPGGQGPMQGRGGRMGGPGGGPGGPILPGLNQLDLTDAQKDQIRSIMESSRPATDLGEAVRAAEQALHTAVLGSNLQGIAAAKAAIATAHAAELDHRVEVMQKIVAVLTPAQRQQLASVTPPAGRGRGL